MPGPTDRVLKEMHAFMDLHQDEINSQEDMEKLLHEFMNEYNSRDKTPKSFATSETADDYFEAACNAATKKEAQKCLKKALELDPNHTDALHMSLDLKYEDKPDTKLVKYKELLEKEDKRLHEQGVVGEEDIGEYWLIFGTRPYMRLYNDYLQLLCELGKFSLAADVCRDMLRLNSGDNLGARHTYMHVLALLERLEEAEDFMETVEHDESMLTMPMAVLYYKIGDMNQAKVFLKRTAAVNRDLMKFLRAIRNDTLERYLDKMEDYGYKPFSIEELIVEMMDYRYLFLTVPGFYDWAYSVLK